MDRSFSVSESRATSSLDGYAERSKNSAKPKRNVINMGGVTGTRKRVMFADRYGELPER
jgi:hypothetical protein